MTGKPNQVSGLEPCATPDEMKWANISVAATNRALPYDSVFLIFFISESLYLIVMLSPNGLPNETAGMCKMKNKVAFTVMFSMSILRSLECSSIAQLVERRTVNP